MQLSTSYLSYLPTKDTGSAAYEMWIIKESRLLYLFPPRRKFSISTNASLDVVVALSVSTQVDGVRVHMDVHEVVDYFALDVVLHPVH